MPTPQDRSERCCCQSDVIVEFDALIQEVDQAFECMRQKLRLSQQRLMSQLPAGKDGVDWKDFALPAEKELEPKRQTNLPETSKSVRLFSNSKSKSKSARVLAPLEVSSALRTRTSKVVHGISEQGKDESHIQELRLHPRMIELANKSSDILEMSGNRKRPSCRRIDRRLPSGVSVDAVMNAIGNTITTKSFIPAVLQPHSAIRLCWDVAGLFLILIDSFVLPVSLAWDLPLAPIDAAGVFRIITFWTSLVFWSCDIVSNFNTGYYSGGVLVLSRKSIARKYFTTWLLFDVGLIVLDFIMAETLINPNISGSSLLSSIRILRIIRSLRVLRVLKFSRLHSVIEEASIAAGKQWLVLIVAIFNTTFAMMACAHLLACFWYFLGRLRSEAGHQSWIDIAEASDIAGSTQYLHAFLWALNPPAPPPLQPESALERAYCILILGATVVVIGSALSKITGTLGELRSIKEEQTKKRREARTYLHSQNVPMELTVRVMKFVDHKLEHRSSVNLDSSLISPALSTEIHVHQRLQYLTPHPFFALTRTVFPDVFADLCAAMVHNVYGKGEVVFAIDQRAQFMYSTCAGTFSLHQGSLHDIDEKEAREGIKISCGVVTSADELPMRRSGHVPYGIHWFAEESLYAESVVHTSTLRAESFCVAYTLTAEHVYRVLDSSPSCAAMYCEYAKDILKHVKSVISKEAYDHLDYESCALAACKENRIYSQSYPDQKTTLENIALPQQIGEFAGDTLTNRGSDCRSPRDLVEEMLKSSLPAQETSLKLQAAFPELQEETGSHALLSQPGERERSESACLSIVALLTNCYENFTRPQDPKDRLTQSQWESLRHIVTWASPTGDISIPALLALLSIRSLGKSKRVAQQLGPESQRPEQALLRLISAYTNVVPSMCWLTEDEVSMIEATVAIHQEFNLAQMIQGENAPASVHQLQQMIHDKGQHIFRFYILFLIGFMSGLAGGRGSKFLNAKNSESVILGISSLLCVLVESPRDIYWNFMIKRGEQLGLATTNSKDMAIVRLACLARVRDDADLQRLRFSWELLAQSDRQVLVDNLLADGIDKKGIVFEFLPDCIANAQRNTLIGLHTLFDVIVDLITSLEYTGDTLPVLPGTMMRVVNLSEMSVFIQAVQNKHIFHTCVSRCRLHIADGRTYFKMSSANWDRASEAETDATQLAYCMNELLQRQKFVQEAILRLDSTSTSPGHFDFDTV